jgi:phage tail sheath gpL-like
MADVTLQGIPAYAPPGVYVQLDFAQGQAGLPEQVRSALILANGTTQGSQSAASAGTVLGPTSLTPLQTVQDIITLAGPGSPAHLMYASFKAKNPNTPLYWAPVGVATGTAATQVLQISTGTSAQSAGVIQYRVDGKNPVQSVFSSSQSIQSVASGLSAAINSNINLPVTAVPTGSAVVVTAKTAGARGNWLRGFGQVVSGGGVTVTPNSPAFFTGGAGSDATNYTSVLNTVALNGQRYYYVIPEAGGDSVDGTANGIAQEVQSFIDTQALPAVGLRQRAVMGSVDTVPNTAVVATSMNDARCEIIQLKNLDLTPGEFAAQWAAGIMTIEVAPLSAKDINFDNFGSQSDTQALWSVQAPLDGTAPSASDIQTAIINGITPVKVVAGSNTAVVKRCTSRWYSLGGPGGSTEVLDLRITDAGKVTICDYFFDDLANLIALRYSRCLIGNDPVSGSPPPGPGICTPSLMQNTVVEIIKLYAAPGLINGPATLGGLIVQRNVTPSTSIGIVVPLFVADPLHTVLIHGLQLPSIIV